MPRPLLWLLLVVLGAQFGRQVPAIPKVSPQLAKVGTGSDGEGPGRGDGGRQQRLQAGGTGAGTVSKDAYVTLLYGGFLLGARVLGQSLRETGTTKELIALCTDKVSNRTRRVLQEDGWIIKSISNIQSPYEGQSRRGDYFSGIFSKLLIWNMTDYERIVYLDSDTLVLSNIDHMFDCGTFCAAYRHSDLFNAGVLVVEPSREVFNDILSKIASTPSYDDGDQGFLNVYFHDLKYASMFNWSDSRRQHKPMRLPAGLNGDIGIYYTNSRWNIPTESLRVIHFTLGPIKPWIWWSNLLSDINPLWTSVRKRLPQYNFHGDSFEDTSMPLFWLPYILIAVAFMGLRLLEWCCCHRWSASGQVAAALKLFGSANDRVSHFFPLLFLFLSYLLAVEVVPTTMLPSQAQYVFWLWSNFFLLLLIGSYCYLCHVAGKLRDNFHHSFPRKKLQSLALYVIFTLSFVVFMVVPPCVFPFSRRVMAYIVLTVVHLAVSHVTGQCLILLWTGYKVNLGAGVEIPSTSSCVSLKKFHY